jgi:hypothetical protein
MTNVACGKPKPMLVILDGKLGKLQLSRDGVIVYEDVERCLIDERAEATTILSTIVKSGKCNYIMNWFGDSGFWMPKGTISVPSWYYAFLKSRAKIADKFINLFRGKCTRFSKRAAQIISLFSLRASGASDAAKEAIVCGTLKAVVHDLGLNGIISHEQIARATPCEGTFANWELELAAACVCKNVRDLHHERLRLGKAVPLGLITDHKNSKGRGYYAKLLVWCQKIEGDFALTSTTVIILPRDVLTRSNNLLNVGVLNLMWT